MKIHRFVLLLLSVCVPAIAEVSLPSIFSDHMVMQRDRPVHVWGMAAPQERVTVEFRGKSNSTTADELGQWSIYMAPGGAGGPFKLAVKSTNALTLNDVMVGDVWFASGQSNMEFSMSDLANAAEQIAEASHPNIRYLRAQHQSSAYPLRNAAVDAWTTLDPQSARSFSAVAYYFAREIEAQQHVPIGIIESAWGGTVAEAWTSTRALADPSLSSVFTAWANMQEREETELLLAKRDLELKAAGKPTPKREWHPELQSWAPSGLYNAMVAPFTPFAIRGVIWYQGESNSRPDRNQLYRLLFPALIRDWRARWQQGDFPFLFVQIANFASGPGEDWAVVRDAQRETLSLTNTGMAVTIDIGDAEDVHPKNKKDVGHRLALAARAVSYGENIEYSGPLMRSVIEDERGLRIWFDHAASGLVAKRGALKGFEVAGEDGKYVPAQASTDGTTIVVSSASVAQPRSVRYAWSNNPEANLYNAEGLPASPFRWPMVQPAK